MLLSWVRALCERLRSFVDKAVDDELGLCKLAREADRKAELLRLAERYEAEGLAELAGEVRGQAGQIALATQLPPEKALAYVPEGVPGNGKALARARTDKRSK